MRNNVSLPTISAGDMQGGRQQVQNLVHVLQVVENLNDQATENWLLQVLSRMCEQHPLIKWTFFCVLGEAGRMDEFARRLGATVIHSKFSLSQKRQFLSSLRKFMVQNRFDVLHCHHDVMSALPLLASVGLPIRRRIVHVHNTSLAIPTKSVAKRVLLRTLFRRICLSADRVVGVSQEALSAMLAGKKPRPHRDQVIHCGVETSGFELRAEEISETRQSFGLAPNARILLFVGRMIPYKNPTFVIDVLRHLQANGRECAAVFAGTGPLQDTLLQMAAQAGLQDRVRVLGWRRDVPALMQACDLMIWPGLEKPKEGLGLGVVQAQAACLPVLMSHSVPEEAIVIPELVSIMPLSSGSKSWAEAASALLDGRRPLKADALTRVRMSSFSIENSAANIAELYAPNL